MTPAQQIHSWLAGKRDYQEGLRLYSIYGPFAHLAKLMAHRNMPEKLLAEMRNLSKKYPLAKGEAPVKKIVQPVPEISHQQTTSPKLPAQDQTIAEFNEKARELMDERRFLHSQKLLKTLPKDQVHQAAKRILEIGHALDNLYDKQEHYQQHGNFKEDLQAESIAAMKPAEMVIRIETLKKYLRKYRDKPGKQALYDKYSAELKELEKRLNEL